jgi:hypothetical protein
MQNCEAFTLLATSISTVVMVVIVPWANSKFKTIQNNTQLLQNQTQEVHEVVQDIQDNTAKLNKRGK